MNRIVFYILSLTSIGSLLFATYVLNFSHNRLAAVQERLCFLQKSMVLYDPECYGGKPKPKNWDKDKI
jgi:hypothetical protein